jgi:small GTP-binding protein
MWYRSARGVILCFNLTDRQSFVRANTWLQEISKNCPDYIRTILVGTKADLADRRQVSTEEAKEFAQHAGIPYIETSAKSNINIEEAMKMLVNEIEVAHPLDQELPPRPTVVPVPSRSWCNIL